MTKQKYYLLEPGKDKPQAGDIVFIAENPIMNHSKWLTLTDNILGDYPYATNSNPILHAGIDGKEILK